MPRKRSKPIARMWRRISSRAMFRRPVALSITQINRCLCDKVPAASSEDRWDAVRSSVGRVKSAFDSHAPPPDEDISTVIENAEIAAVVAQFKEGGNAEVRTEFSLPPLCKLPLLFVIFVLLHMFIHNCVCVMGDLGFKASFALRNHLIRLLPGFSPLVLYITTKSTTDCSIRDLLWRLSEWRSRVFNNSVRAGCEGRQCGSVSSVETRP